VIREEHRGLGPMSFGELSVLSLFVLLVVLWFTREPGFVDGWATDIFNAKAEFVYFSDVLCVTSVRCYCKSQNDRDMPSEIEDTSQNTAAPDNKSTAGIFSF